MYHANPYMSASCLSVEAQSPASAVHACVYRRLLTLRARVSSQRQAAARIINDDGIHVLVALDGWHAKNRNRCVIPQEAHDAGEAHAK